MTQELIERLTKLREERGRIYEVAGDAVDVALAEAADALQSQSARIAELEGALQAIVDGNVFNQQRFAEDDDADYFLRCFKAVKERAQVSLTKDSTSVTKEAAK